MSVYSKCIALALAASVQAGVQLPTIPRLPIPSLVIPTLPSLPTLPFPADTAAPGSPSSGSYSGSSSAGFFPPHLPFAGGAGVSTSPAYPWKFENALPLPPVAQPKFTQINDGVPVQFYESTIEAFSHQVYPNLGPAQMVGYNGTFPGPTYMIPRGTETVIRHLNNGTENATVHLHGSYTHSVWDGWASDDVPPGMFKDYYYPNSESARPMWYHDHVHGHTARHAYYGQAGIYIIYDPAEDVLGLPSGAYDVPLAITDRSYQSNGDLASPEGSPMNYFGDTIEVNGQPWPFLAVEPRKYRLRFFDMSLSRAYTLSFEDAQADAIPFQVIGSDSGLFASPVDSDNVTISTGERYEVVVDFANFAGQNITLTNGFNSPDMPGYPDVDKVMRFVVGSTVFDTSNNGAVPSKLSDIPWPTQKKDVDHVFNFQIGVGPEMWTINGVTFNDVNNRVLARPPQGTVELWELVHSGGPAVHPVHIHLVNMQIISRTGGSRGLLPYEAAGLKDVVLLEPGETVQVLAVYGPWNGMYMFHCHNLIHEDQMMLDVFNVTKLEQLGYEFNGTQGFWQPMDTRFAPQEFSVADFETDAEIAAVRALAELDAYTPATSLMAAEAAFYQTASATTVVAQVTNQAVVDAQRRNLNGPSRPGFWQA